MLRAVLPLPGFVILTFLWIVSIWLSDFEESFCSYIAPSSLSALRTAYVVQKDILKNLSFKAFSVYVRSNYYIDLLGIIYELYQLSVNPLTVQLFAFSPKYYCKLFCSWAWNKN